MITQAWKLEFLDLRSLIQIAGDLCALFCSWKLTLSSSQSVSIQMKGNPG